MVEDPETRQFSADIVIKGKLFGRDFFFNVLNTLQLQSVKQIVEYPKIQRYVPAEEKSNKEAIIITDDWHDLLTT